LRRIRVRIVGLVVAVVILPLGLSACGGTSSSPAAAASPLPRVPEQAGASPTGPGAAGPQSPAAPPGSADPQSPAAPPGTGAASPQPPATRPGTRYLTPTTHITPAKGCTRLTPGMNGIKVKMVQRRLGFPADTWETMDRATIAAVKRFQQRAGIDVDGVVGPQTWTAMGFREDFCFDRYQAAILLPRSASAAARVEQVIAFADRFLGEEYVWGGAGPRGYGVDCSGLILQALYSAGLDPQPITVDKHVLPRYRTSRELYAHPRLRHLPRSAARRGDLVFWRSNTTGKINHVALYLGDGKVLEAVEPKVHIGRLTDRSTQAMMPDAVRPF
jgi:cell wall-associated NlpC family hydrolase